jgi:hypothetical protein
LVNSGLEQDTEEATLFYTTNRSIILATFVDDMLVLWKDETEWNQLTHKIGEQLKVKIVNKPTLFLGMHLNWTNDGVKISHGTYISDLLEKTDMQSCKGVTTPMEGYATEDAVPEPNNSDNMCKYQQWVRGLLYLSQTSRPEITCAVNYYAKFAKGPLPVHWTGLKRILRYLAKTKDFGITVVKQSTEDDQPLKGYSDSDFSSDPISRMSRIGYVFTLYDTPIVQKSTFTKLPALSTTESEYIALTEATKEAIFLYRIVQSLGIKQSSVPIFMDNQGSITIANHPAQHQRTKHYATRLNFIRHHLKTGTIEVKYIPSSDNPADIFTKPLQRIKFQTNCERLRITAREGVCGL